MVAKLKRVVQKIHDDVENNVNLFQVINNGGCGVFAYYFLKQCEKYGVKGVGLAYLDLSFEALKPEERLFNIKNCSKNKGLDISAHHIMVTINKRTFLDAKYVGNCVAHRYSHLSRTDISVPSKLIGRTLKVPGQWNSQYNRDVFNPIIRRIINQAFKKEYSVVVTK